MSVERILTHKGHDVVTADASISLHDVARILADKRIGSVVLVSGDRRIKGIISERDVVRACAEHGAKWTDIPVSDVMTRKVHTCQAQDRIEDIMSLMSERRVRHLPVVDSGKRLVGLVSIGDVVKSRLSMIEQEAQEMLRYISG